MRLAWSRTLPLPPVGLSLAREPGTLLVWDAEGTLTRLDAAGHAEQRHRDPVPLAAAALSDDGRLVALAGGRGDVCLLTLDFVPVWRHALPRGPTAVAIDHLGRRLAVADEAGGLTVFDRDGVELWRASAPRPLKQLAFVPETPVLLGAAEFGLVCAFDAAGNVAWRDGLVAHVGSLATSGTGASIVLACFTDGLCRYALAGSRAARLPGSPPARLVALSYPGDVVAVAGLERLLYRCGADGTRQGEIELPAAPVALALEALGNATVAALADGTLVRVEMG